MKKILIFLAAAGVMGVSSAQAATIESCKVTDFENSIITVTGTVLEGEDKITVAVVPKGVTLSAGKYYSDAVSVQDAVIKEGTFSAAFKFNASVGTYTVNATNSEGMDFEWIDKDSVLTFVGQLGDGKISDDDIFAELSRYGSSIGVDVSFANDNQSYLVGNVNKYLKVIDEKGIEGVKSVVNLTRAELEFMEKLKSTTVASSVNGLIKEYAESANIDITSYDKLSDGDKTQVCNEFIGESYSGMQSFRNDFKTEVGKYSEGSGGSSGGTPSASGGNSSGLKPSGTGMTISTTTGEYADTESGKNARLFEIFEDVENVSWGWEAILFVYDKGIMNGVGSNQFKPNDVLTREQFAKVITLAFDKYNADAVSDFYDVERGGWAESYIASAKDSGLMQGVTDTEFGYGKSLTRQDICVVIYRAAKGAGMTFDTQKTDFSDYEEISDYAREAVGSLAGAGIISGMGDGSFSPRGQATRAQAAKLIYAVLGGNV